MNLTVEQLKALSFGYLTGSDLCRFAAAQLLIKQYEVDADCLQDACDTAYSEISNKLSTKFNLVAEFSKTGSTKPDIREKVLVKIASLFAVRNALGNAQNISEIMQNHFKWADKEVYDLRNAQDGLPKVEQASPTTIGSISQLVDSNFSTQG